MNEEGLALVSMDIYDEDSGSASMHIMPTTDSMVHLQYARSDENGVIFRTTIRLTHKALKETKELIGTFYAEDKAS